jgi:AcrR family transcriptional regulator
MMTTPSRRRAPAMSPDQRRDMIVRVALPLVAEHGTALTTSQVARAAGIAEGTVFRAFADKNELMAACVAAALRSDHLIDALAAIPLDLPLADRLVEAGESLRAHLARLGAVLGALHGSGYPLRRPAPGEGRPAGLDRETATVQIREAVADLFAPEKDALRRSPDLLADVFLRLLFTPRRCAPGEQSTEPTTAELVDLFLHGALDGEPAEPAEPAEQPVAPAA